MIDRNRRSFEAGETFQRFLRNFFSKFIIWLGIATFCAMIIGGIGALLEWGLGWEISAALDSEVLFEKLESGGGSIEAFLILYVYILLQTSFTYLTLSACCAAAQAMREGQTVTLWETITVALRHFPAVIAVSLIVSVAATASCCFAPIILTMWIAAVPAVVLEGRSVGTALHRSAWLTRGIRFQVFLAWLIIFLIGLPLGFIAAMLGGVLPSLTLPLTIISMIISGAIQGVGLVTIFLDLVEAKERRGEGLEDVFS